MYNSDSQEETNSEEDYFEVEKIANFRFNR